MTTRGDALLRGISVLAGAGIERPAFEARLLLAAALGISQAVLLADRRAAAETDGFERLLARRAAREPLALIVGQREFWSMPFRVSRATLVPRPDSEALIEAAVACFPDRRGVRTVLDLGTGTGCLLLAALTEFAASGGIGVDIAPEAALLARGNAGSLGLGGRAAFLAGDWAAAVDGRFDLILCNPPYIESAAIGGLMPEVALHEPALALDGGVDGLDAYRAIVPDLRRLLAQGGAAILELGTGQAAAVATLAAAAGFTAEARADLSGIPRALVLRKARP